MNEAYEKALKSIPAPGGNGCHVALLRVANIGVLQGLSDSQLVSDLRANIPAGKRSVPDKEIEDAVKKARETAKGTPREGRAFVGYDWDDVVPIPDLGGNSVVSGKDSVEERVTEPETWNPCDDFRRQLKAMFQPDERPMIQTGAFRDGDSWRINGKGDANRTRDELLAELSKYEKNHSPEEALRYAIGDWTEGGAWIRVNPMDGEGGFDRNVTDMRHALVECDGMELDTQLALIRKLNLPCACITYSGGKSIHAVVKVQASNLKEYHDRFDYLKKVCKANGMELDEANRNPSRFSRLAGVTRGERRQFIIDTDCGAKGWQEWVDFAEETTDDLPDVIDSEDWLDNPPARESEVIEGVLRRKCKMLLTASSKAGKSFALLELGYAIATGGKWLIWNCTKGKVMYVDMELGDSNVHVRMMDIEDEIGLSETRREVRKNLKIWSLRGKSRPMKTLKDMLVRRCKGKDYSAIIVDPIYKVQDGDENSAGEMTRFCNFFDEIAERTGAAIVMAHHHSKGAQGGKNAIDRSSGSGVFARDPDAILDMVELELDDNRRKAVTNLWGCEMLGKALDKTSPNWRSVVPQDVQVVADKLAAEAQPILPHAMQILASARDKAAKATLFRVETSLREYAKPRTFNVWYRHPIHIVDESGISQDALAQGEQPPKASREKSANNRRIETISAITLAYEELMETATKPYVTIGELADASGMTERTLRNYIGRYDTGLKNRNGNIMRKEAENEL